VLPDAAEGGAATTLSHPDDGQYLRCGGAAERGHWGSPLSSRQRAAFGVELDEEKLLCRPRFGFANKTQGLREARKRQFFTCVVSGVEMPVDLSSLSELDDRPPLTADHLVSPAARHAALVVDEYLGMLEVSATWARNTFRDAVAVDTAQQYRGDFVQVGRLMAELALLAQSLDALFLRSGTGHADAT
jgi:hypothetical protein